jgi:hypothetical protein
MNSKTNGVVGHVVDNAVRGFVNDFVHESVREAVYKAVREAVSTAVDWNVTGVANEANHQSLKKFLKGLEKPGTTSNSRMNKIMAESMHMPGLLVQRASVSRSVFKTPREENEYRVLRVAVNTSMKDPDHRSLKKFLEQVG